MKSLGKAKDKGVPHDELALARAIADMERKNDKFASMTPAQQRVTIAKDVLVWLRAGRLEARNGTYLWLTQPTPGKMASDCNWDETGSEVVNGFNCVACGLGSVFAAVAERVGGFGEALASMDSYTMREKLGPYFSEGQLKDIEAAFEGVPGESLDCWPYENPKAASFNYDIPRGDPASGEKRMIRIMKNIIAHKGTFRPDQPVHLKVVPA